MRFGDRRAMEGLGYGWRAPAEELMVRALGFSENRFDPKDPGRLCRGRERWIEPWEIDGPVPVLYRTVISGAVFSDDGASDARRGLSFSGIEFATVVETLYSGSRWMVFMEDGHPADIPPDAQGVEAYEGYRAEGRQELGLVRWWLPIEPRPPKSRAKGPHPGELLKELIGPGPVEERIRGLVVADADVDVAELMDRVFHLVGFSTLDSPPARYQPSALPEVLELAKAVLLIHRDKHGPALAIYARDPIPDLRGRLMTLCEPAEALLVPFAIPPMLARWDRALAELRAEWPSTHSEPFPVPAASPSSGEESRRHRRWGRDDEEVDRLVDEPSEPFDEEAGQQEGEE
jgi:hypothetical protein